MPVLQEVQVCSSNEIKTIRTVLKEAVLIDEEKRLSSLIYPEATIKTMRK